ncbi:MAG: endolytic transglycosylase MltG [Armatimonadetes bacterium]|nr:endolytic transglycosylase MltG [Armatimonadota bacterium]
MNRRVRFLLWVLGVGILTGAGFGYWLNTQLAPMPPADPVYVRYEVRSPLVRALEDLEKRSIVRNARVLALWSRFKRYPALVGVGTYQVRPGMKPEEILAALQLPVRRMVRLPETNWLERSANLLEKNGVCKAGEYVELAHDPARFKDLAGFPIPESGSLEGYLYPDTYDLPPLIGAEGTVKRQLEAFRDKVWRVIEPPKDLRRVLTVASLVQLEVKEDPERPIVAGVIENRLRLGMPLQIDATILYAMKKWKNLSRAEIAGTDSPYNTYLRKGLPPGPICSPSFRSIDAALHPAKHSYLYYVALPTGKHLFSATYDEHLRNIQRRKKALAQGGP